MPDMHGKTVLITGATSGIGRESATQLARMGAHVFVHGRTAERAAAASASIARDSRSESVSPVFGDLSSLSQVRALAAAVTAQTDELHVLVNNAGVYMRDRVLTEDGHETTWAVNHLAHFALTLALERLLANSAPARVVTVSSVAHFRGTIDFADPERALGYDGYGSYAASKLMNVLFSMELADHLAGTGVTSNALHPGIIDTRLLHDGFPGQQGASPETGATTVVYLASSPDVEDTSGRYFVNQHPAHPAPATEDLDLRHHLWLVSDDLTRAISV
ncbi:MAG: SDR family NAD(P)-dependent oxidoreductase [Coriobacteriia bacterium]|nr:SDR family NAD(P)-dependent oxidoreductase [Coriobacteriia bacterium]